MAPQAPLPQPFASWQFTVSPTGSTTSGSPASPFSRGPWVLSCRAHFGPWKRAGSFKPEATAHVRLATRRPAIAKLSKCTYGPFFFFCFILCFSDVSSFFPQIIYYYWCILFMFWLKSLGFIAKLARGLEWSRRSATGDPIRVAESTEQDTDTL